MLIELLISLAGGRIEGTVVDERGLALTGVRVLVGELGHATLYYTTPQEMFVGTPGVPEAEAARYSALRESDEHGQFVIEGLAAGEYSFLAADATRGIAFTSLRLGQDTALAPRLVLQPPAFALGTVSGLAFDSTVDVLELKPRQSSGNIAFIPRLVQESGRWGFRSVALPAVREWKMVGTRVVLEHDYRATLFSLPLDAETGEESKLTFAFDGGSSVTGRVLDEGGAPVSGVSVVAVSKSIPTRELGAVSDAGGAYRISGLSHGAWRLDATRFGMRALPGCGNGPQQLSGSHNFLVSAPTQELELRVHVCRETPKVGASAPDFEVTRIDGRTLKLSELRGKYVLLDFWATWCSMCRSHFPRLIETYTKAALGGRFEVVGISVDEDVDLVRRFVASRGMRWPQTALGPAKSNAIAQLYNVNSTPTAILIGPDGTVLEVELFGEALCGRIDALCASKQAR